MQIEIDTQQTEGSADFFRTTRDGYKLAVDKTKNISSVESSSRAFSRNPSKTISLLKEQLVLIETQLNFVNSHREIQSPVSLPNELLNIVAMKHQETIVTLKNALRELIR